jgi:hypothetical protein
MPDERSYMESRPPCQQHPRFGVCASENWRANAQPNLSFHA